MNGLPVLDLKASSGEVTFRVGGVGWLTYVVEGEDQGVYRTGRLDIDDADYRPLPRAGNAIVSDGNVDMHWEKWTRDSLNERIQT